MVSSARQAIASVFLILSFSIFAHSQIPPAKSPTAVISGKVSIKGKGAPGVVVFATGSNNPTARQRATTDYLGNYRISNLPAGTYEVKPIAPAFVVEKGLHKTLLISEGETVEDVNFALVHGGVITGKVTDSESQPLIEEHVSLSSLEGPDSLSRYHAYIQTDDRGVYRAFGLPKGKYKVSVGQSGHSLPGPRPSYRKTYHPSVVDSEKATVIEVAEGSEVRNVDIVVVDEPITTFKVTGRIVDGETGKPLPNVTFAVSKSFDNGSTSSSRGPVSDATGEFHMQNVTPGRYSLHPVLPENNEMRADTLSFEVSDRDLTGLLIKTRKGASLSGMILLDGSEERLAAPDLNGVKIFVWMEDSSNTDFGRPPRPVGADGSFKITGLGSGIAHISVASVMEMGLKILQTVRVERNGVTQSRGINVQEGEQITDIRLIVKYLSGVIRGQVTMENGEPPSSQVSVWLVRLDAASKPQAQMYQPSVQIDSRGKFFIEGVAAGSYEVTASLTSSSGEHLKSKQQIVVVDNSVSEVTLTLKPASRSGRP